MNEDPYEILGIPQSTVDERILKKAYKIKSQYLDPKKTNGVTKREWDALNRAYVYLKKKNMATTTPQRTKKSFDFALEEKAEQFANDRMQDSMHLHQKQQKHPVYLPRFTPHVDTSRKIRRIDQQEAFDTYQRKSNSINSMIRERPFDADEAYTEMMKYRPKSTKYSDLLNESFDKNDTLENLNITPWGGFDMMDQTASIVDDGNIMVIHEGNSMHFDNSTTSLSNNFSDEYSFDGGNSKKLSKAEFRKQMSMMERDFAKKLAFEQEKNKSVIMEHFNSIQ